MMASPKNVERRMKFNAVTTISMTSPSPTTLVRVVLSVERPEGHDGDWWQLSTGSASC
jgi:hypothetical protein